jgi:hypothetical protein
VLCVACYSRYQDRGTLERTSRKYPPENFVRRCTYEFCDRPEHSRRFHKINGDNKAGGRDWGQVRVCVCARFVFILLPASASMAMSMPSSMSSSTSLPVSTPPSVSPCLSLRLWPFQITCLLSVHHCSRAGHCRKQCDACSYTHASSRRLRKLDTPASAHVLLTVPSPPDGWQGALPGVLWMNPQPSTLNPKP